MSDHTETAFYFKCGTRSNLRQIKAWIRGAESYPQALKSKLVGFGIRRADEVYAPQPVAEAVAEDQNVLLIDAPKCADIEAIAFILDYAIQRMPEVPSPQGFTWASWSDLRSPDSFTGGAIVLRRGVEMRWNTPYLWLEEQLGTANPDVQTNSNLAKALEQA